MKHIRGSYLREEQFQRFINVAMASNSDDDNGGDDDKSNYRIDLCARRSYLIKHRYPAYPARKFIISST